MDRTEPATCSMLCHKWIVLEVMLGMTPSSGSFTFFWHMWCNWHSVNNCQLAQEPITYHFLLALIFKLFVKYVRSTITSGPVYSEATETPVFILSLATTIANQQWPSLLAMYPSTRIKVYNGLPEKNTFITPTTAFSTGLFYLKKLRT